MKQILLFLFTLFSFSLFGQYQLTGIVHDDEGSPLSFATLKLENRNIQTVADAEGKFSIGDLAQGDYDLWVFYIGYKPFNKSISIEGSQEMIITLELDSYTIDDVYITSNRVKSDGVFAYTDIEKKGIEINNLGQDAPYLLKWTPSAVVTSDAGTGIGYTSYRLRGSDPTRINVTINGVAINDAESQTVFWVNMPDFSSSIENVQVQRGVGPSTNGAGAFGGTISMKTELVSTDPYAELNATYGSFNTQKFAVKAGTGLMDNGFFLDGRYSIINSDGYIDRGSADLNAWYLSAGKVWEKSSLKLISFSGKETTAQAWNGVPESILKGDATDLQNHYDRNIGSLYNTVEDSLNLFDSDRSYNYYTYENQDDVYRQTHYQGLYNYEFNNQWNIKSTFHYTRGKGYFKQFKYDDDFEDYGYESDESGDLVRRRWLDNHNYGVVLNANYTPNETTLWEMGAAASRYDGDHYGNVILSEGLSDLDVDRRYYDNSSVKDDANAYVKFNKTIDKFNLFADFQYRYISYTTEGVDSDLRSISIDQSYVFFNPKVGVNYSFNQNNSAYFSVAVANREPDRNDFIDNTIDMQPLSERLIDYELGYTYNDKNLYFSWNNYFMNYKDQLVLTGALNDVGSNIRQNVNKSYRLGTEITANYKIMKNLEIGVSGTFSRNKIEKFTEVLYDYTIGYDIIKNHYDDVDIAYSPSTILSGRLFYRPVQGAEIEWSTKHVGSQYLDNTMNNARTLEAYMYSDLRLSYAKKIDSIGKVGITFSVLNLFDNLYESNGYTYSYIVGETITENFLFPQAGRHFMVGLNLKI